MSAGPYRSKNGWYHIVWSRRGKKTKEALKTKNMQEARKRKAQLEARFFSGEHDPFTQKWYEQPEAEFIPVEAAAEMYISFKLKQKGRKGWKSDLTYRSHKAVIDIFVDYIGQMPVSRIDAETLDAFLHRPTINSRYTRVSYKAKIGGFLRWCKEKGYIEEIPNVEVNPPQKPVIEYIPDQKLKEVFGEMDKISSRKSHWHGDWCRFAVDSGLRPIEVQNIKVSDITDSDIYVGKSFRTKTNLARKVPLMGMAKEVSEKYKDAEFRETDWKLRGSDHLFGRESRGAIEFVNSNLKDACKEKGCRQMTVKELRHLFAIRFLIRNENKDLGLLRLMRVMGHTRLETTQSYLNYLPNNNKL